VDNRMRRSRDRLIEAVTSALDAPGAQLPSITELCAAAGVSRPTLYQHFGDVPSLIDAAAIARLRTLFLRVAPASPVDDPARTVPLLVRELLTDLLEHATFYRNVLTGPSAQAFHARVVTFLAERLLTFSPIATRRRSSSTDGHSLATFMAAGSTWLAVEWLLGDDPHGTAEGSAAIISSTLSTGFSGFLYTDAMDAQS